ncbi:DinB family protein [Terrimonas sp. NA20]|uniref:DinB family protein n=1 Tax=Terrimonas ginsenosidimutans TaxID=2908004 RepID=A0ABS9KWE4_9BACT|nr:DinB family protein [Terrimonas ginsenosidimutans]MCG2616640.1 DinB family protein [Terrimonas ginsenosidimutans]
MSVDLSRVGDWYHNYIRQIPDTDISSAFNNNDYNLTGYFSAIPAEKHDYRYAEGKWTIREVLQHIIDAERIFVYRALRFARKDSIPLPGFDENMYADNSRAQSRKWDDLVTEFDLTRRSSALFFLSLDEEQLDANGVSSGSPTYVKALGYITLGHAMHHKRILEERYTN